MAGRWDGSPCQACGRRKTPSRRADRYCGPCHRRISQEKARQAHDRYLQRTYGITVEQYEAILAEQGGTCYICRRPARGRLTVDHDHATGEVRGLLCRFDNNLLGQAHDDLEYFARAVAYLVSPPARLIRRNHG